MYSINVISRNTSTFRRAPNYVGVVGKDNKSYVLNNIDVDQTIKLTSVSEVLSTTYIIAWPPFVPDHPPILKQ